MAELPQLAVLRERKRQLVAESDRLRGEITDAFPPIERLARWVDIGIKASRVIRNMASYGSPLVLAGLGIITALGIKAGFSKEGFGGLFARVLKTSNYLSAGWNAFQKLKGSWQFLRNVTSRPKSQIAQ